MAHLLNSKLTNGQFADLCEILDTAPHALLEEVVTHNRRRNPQADVPVTKPALVRRDPHERRQDPELEELEKISEQQHERSMPPAGQGIE